jgi:hypothetical protein
MRAADRCDAPGDRFGFEANHARVNLVRVTGAHGSQRRRRALPAGPRRLAHKLRDYRFAPSVHAGVTRDKACFSVVMTSVTSDVAAPVARRSLADIVPGCAWLREVVTEVSRKAMHV